VLVPTRAGSGIFSELVNENLLTVNGNTWLACAPAPPQCGQLLIAAPPHCGQIGVLSAPLQADSTWGATFEFKFDITWYGDSAPCGGVCTNVGRRGVFSRSDAPLRWLRPSLEDFLPDRHIVRATS
jgi:hypothetical protein